MAACRECQEHHQVCDSISPQCTGCAQAGRSCSGAASSTVTRPAALSPQLLDALQDLVIVQDAIQAHVYFLTSTCFPGPSLAAQLVTQHLALGVAADAFLLRVEPLLAPSTNLPVLSFLYWMYRCQGLHQWLQQWRPIAGKLSFTRVAEQELLDAFANATASTYVRFCSSSNNMAWSYGFKSEEFAATEAAGVNVRAERAESLIAVTPLFPQLMNLVSR